MEPQAIEVVGFVQRYQLLFAAGFGIIAALIGFGGVMYTQYRIARNANSEREHRERMARQERDHASAERRTTLIHALTGELSSLYQRCANVEQQLHIQHALYNALMEKAGEEYERELSKINIPVFETVIFDKFIGDIGLLPPSITASVAKIYGQYRGYKPIEYNPAMPLKMYVGVLDAFVKAFGGLRNSTHDLVMRLHAIRLDYPDPGEDKGAEFGKYLNQQKDALLPEETKAE